MNRLSYFKMHSFGNSCVIVADPERKCDFSSDFCSLILDPHRGVGADNLMVIFGLTEGVYQISGYNLDGSSVGLCANGVRCVTWLVSSVFAEQIEIPRLSGTGTFDLDGVSVTGRVVEDSPPMVQVNLEPPRFEKEAIPFLGESSTGVFPVADRKLSFSVVNVGNPHCLFFVDEQPTPEEISHLGPLVENHELFPNRTNVEFLTVKDDHHLSCRIWERGVGVTQSSGTGASASAVAAISAGVVQSPVEVEMPGGTLQVEWEIGGDISVLAPCCLVSSGVYYF